MPTIKLQNKMALSNKIPAPAKPPLESVAKLHAALTASDLLGPLTYEPEIWSVEKDAIYAAIRAVESGLEYARECLATHEVNLGRTTLKNKTWSEMAEVLEIRRAKTVEEVIDHAKWLIMSYRGMCDRLQASVQKHHLGLGGEKVDVLVCEALDSALSANAPALAQSGGDKTKPKEENS